MENLSIKVVEYKVAIEVSFRRKNGNSTRKDMRDAWYSVLLTFKCWIALQPVHGPPQGKVPRLRISNRAQFSERLPQSYITSPIPPRPPTFMAVQSKESLSPWGSALAGALGAVFANTCVYPLDMYLPAPRLTQNQNPHASPTESQG
jgi:hypothetical protein